MKNARQQTACIGLISAVCLCLLSPSAFAEAGDGVEGETFRLRLSAAAGTSVNSNLFYQEEPTAPTALALVVTPGLQLSSVRTDKVALTLNSGLTWTQYISQLDALSQQSGLGINLGAAAHFNQAGNVSFRLEEELQRTNEPPNGPNVNAINRFNNRLGGIVGIHPGGRALQSFLSYHWASINFNNPDLNFSEANRDEHALQGRFIWQFRPRTAASLTANYTFVNYDQAARQVGGTAIPNINSRPLRIQAGLNGLVLRNLDVLLQVGYGRANYSVGPSFNGVIGRAKLTYYIQSLQDAKTSLGYTRGFTDSFIGNFVLDNRVDFVYTQPFIDNRLNLNLGAFYARRNYQIGPGYDNISIPSAEVSVDSPLLDNRIGANFGLNFALKKWLSVQGGYTLNTNITNSNVEVVSVDDNFTGVAGRSFVQHIVNASITATY